MKPSVSRLGARYSPAAWAAAHSGAVVMCRMRRDTPPEWHVARNLPRTVAKCPDSLYRRESGCALSRANRGPRMFGRRQRGRARRLVSMAAAFMVLTVLPPPAAAARPGPSPPRRNPSARCRRTSTASRAPGRPPRCSLLRGRQLRQLPGHGPDTDRTMERHELDDRRRARIGRRGQRARRRHVRERDELLRRGQLAGDADLARDHAHRAVERTRLDDRSEPQRADATGSFLHAVSCVGPNRCFAVGNYKSGGTSGSTLIERWTGTAWVVSPSPNKPGAAVNTLDGVSCVPAGTGVSCFAVGSYSTSATGQIPFTLTDASGRTAGRSSRARTSAAVQERALFGVVHEPDRSAWRSACGNTRPGASLAEKWNGRTWTITPVQNFAGWTFSQLNSVSCLSASNCYAVGSWASGRPHKTLVAHGTAPRGHHREPEPDGRPGSTLAGVSCIGARCSPRARRTSRRPSVGPTLTERNF